MSNENLSLLRYKRKYQNKWVALRLKDSKVLASDSNLKKLATKLTSKKEEYVLEKVAPLDKALVPFTLFL